MDVKRAAEDLLDKYLKGMMYIKDSDALTIEHANWMLNGIVRGYIQDEKAHRWLGYAQAIIVLSGYASIYDMKHINKGTRKPKESQNGTD